MDGRAKDVTQFWRQAGAEKWFRKDSGFDEEIRARFLALHEQAARGAFHEWENSAEGALALLLLLDQFPRNMFRGSAHAFATDAMALNIARRALAKAYDSACGDDMQLFFFLPFMHSENIADQELCVVLCRMHKMEENTKFAEIHRDIIARFGRFPNRNAVMGRVTGDEEQAFLDGGGFAG